MANAYQGEYVAEISEAFRSSGVLSLSDLENFKPSEPVGEDIEKSLDQAIMDLRTFLGSEKFDLLRDFSCEYVLKDIQKDLFEFRVHFDSWFSENRLVKDGSVIKALDELEEKGEIYIKEGASWFKASNHGDEKDRVLIREDGRYTYFATDIAYHSKKISEGFDKIVNIWGADHHGYIPRLCGALRVVGIEKECLEFILVQFASLVEDGQKIAMSTRKGSFVTLGSLIQDVGVDAARFFYLIRRADQHMDFDISLAKEKSAKNPVYYIQYAYARISSVLRQARLQGWKNKTNWKPSGKSFFIESERDLVLSLSLFPDVVKAAARSGEPNLVAQYLKDLAYLFHSNYAANKILVEDADLREARLELAASTRQVLENGLKLLDISTPEKM